MSQAIHQTIEITAADGGKFNAHVSLPREVDDDKAPCVIVIQEIFGINQGIRDKCDWLASQGFMAVAPDLFWRIQPSIELSDQIPEELERAFELFGIFDVDKGIDDLKSTVETVKDLEFVGKVGCLGYCLGGKLAYLLGCKSNTVSSVSYYGVGIENLLSDANNLTGKILMHIAREDGFVPPEAQQTIEDGLKDNDNITLHFYEDVDHAFTREGGDNYNAAAAKIADERSIEFLKANLKP